MSNLRHSITEFVLDLLQSGAETSAELFVMMLKSRPDSYRRARRGLAGAPGIRFEKRWSEMYRKRKNFNSVISKLKRDGLISSKKDVATKKFRWYLTEEGKQAYSDKKKALRSLQWLRNPASSSVVTVISYDIPEFYSRERAWLREILRLLGFGLAHKSLWIGMVRIPREFIQELERRGIREYLHIFEVTKRGTLSKI